MAPLWSLSGLRRGVIICLAEERLLYMAVQAAGSVRLSYRGWSFSSFQERLESAKVLFDDKIRILAERREQTESNGTERIRILHLGPHKRTATLRIVAELDPAAGFKLRAGQGTPGDTLVGLISSDLCFPADTRVERTLCGPFRTTVIQNPDISQVRHEERQFLKVTPKLVGFGGGCVYAKDGGRC
jgi:hypothetical protein